MNRERLTILRDHLASLPDDRVDLSVVQEVDECGTVACIAGWAGVLARRDGDAKPSVYFSMDDAEEWLGLSETQGPCLFLDGIGSRTPRADAIAAIQSMLDNPADDALPIWPEVVDA